MNKKRLLICHRFSPFYPAACAGLFLSIALFGCYISLGHLFGYYAHLHSSFLRILKTYWLSNEVSWITNLEQWPGLKAIGAVHSYVERDREAHEETRYFITSVTDIKIFAHAVRSHRGVENSLHWCLDEDHSTMRVDNSGENFAVIRHIALNLLKSYPLKNVSLTRKRRRCGYDDNFVADVFFSQF